MDPGPVDRPQVPATIQSWRWFFLTLLLLVELLSFAILLFDVGDASQRRDWLSILLGPKPRGLVIGVVTVGAVLLLGTRVLKQHNAGDLENWRGYREWPFLVAHGLALLGLIQATTWMFREPSATAQPWFIFLWCLLALAVLATWALCLLPGKIWRELLPNGLEIVVVGFCVAIGSALLSAWSTQLWNPLGTPTVWFVGQLLALFNSDVVYDRQSYLVGTPQFTVEIAPACSGYEGLGLISVFLAVALWVLRDRLNFCRAWLLFPLGLLAMWLANGLRIAALIQIGTSWSEGIAMRSFHSQAGWLAFMIVALGLLAFALRSPWLMAPDTATEAAVADDQWTTAYLLPLLVMVGSSMLTAAFSDADLRTLYPLCLIASALTLFFFRRAYQAWNWQWSLPSIGWGVAVFLIWVAVPRLVTWLWPAAQPGIENPGPASHLEQGLRVAGYVLLTPVIEELAFRGYLLRRLISRDFQNVSLQSFSWTSFLVSSLVFGLAHGRFWFSGTLAGMAYAIAGRRRGALGDAVLAHGTTNALLAACAVYYGDWHLIS